MRARNPQVPEMTPFLVASPPVARHVVVGRAKFRVRGEMCGFGSTELPGYSNTLIQPPAIKITPEAACRTLRKPLSSDIFPPASMIPSSLLGPAKASRLEPDMANSRCVAPLSRWSKTLPSTRLYPKNWST